MRLRTRHPRLSAAACRVYGALIWLYPAEFRHAFGHELDVTFRNRVEDVLDGGGILDWLTFAGHIGIDCIRTYSTLVAEARPRGAMSFLGLNDGDEVQACIDRTNVEVSRACAAGGIVLACIVWYAYITYVILQNPVM